MMFDNNNPFDDDPEVTVVAEGHTLIRDCIATAWKPAYWTLTRKGDETTFTFKEIAPDHGYERLQVFEDEAEALRDVLATLIADHEAHSRFVTDNAEHSQWVAKTAKGVDYWRGLAARFLEQNLGKWSEKDWCDLCYVIDEIEAGGPERIGQVLLCLGELAAIVVERLARHLGQDPLQICSQIRSEIRESLDGTDGPYSLQRLAALHDEHEKAMADRIAAATAAAWEEWRSGTGPWAGRRASESDDESHSRG
jgi:hypothetical protein